MQHTVSDDTPGDIRSRFDTVIGDHHIGGRSFRILTVRDPNVLLDAVLPATFAIDERLPYWAELWTSSLVLAERCLASPELAGKRVIDLGCGLGLTGICAAAAGAHVLLSDYEADAMAFAEWNARENLTPEQFAHCSFRVGDWRAPEEFGSCDVVLGADIVYERRNFVPLLACLRATVSDNGEAWFAEPDRSPGQDFFAMAAKDGWRVDLDVRTVERRGRTTTVRIARLRPAGDA